MSKSVCNTVSGTMPNGQVFSTTICGAEETKQVGVISAAFAAVEPLTLQPTRVGDLSGDNVFKARALIAEMNAELDKARSYAMTWDELEGKYPAVLQKIAGFHKSLEHDAYGELTEVGLANYKKFVDGMLTMDVHKLDEVRAFGGARPAFSGATDRINGAMVGMSATGIEMPKAYPEGSNETCAEMVENYLMNMAVDIPFVGYAAQLDPASGPTTLKLAKELLENEDVNRYLIQKSASSGIYTAQNLFRDTNAGSQKGPYVSQLFYHNVNAGLTMGANASWNHAQKYKSPKPLSQLSIDPVKPSAVSWGFTPGQAAALLNGKQTEQFDGTGGATSSTASIDSEQKFIYNGRSLASYVTEEPRAQRVYDAALIIDRWGVPSNPGLGAPFPGTRDNNTNTHSGTPQTIAAVLSNVNNTLAFYWKYSRNRRVRPEAMGLYVHNSLVGAKNYGFPSWFIAREGNLKKLWDAVAEDNEAIRLKYKTGAPLPAVPSYTYHVQTRAGNPGHPSYPAGHAAAISGVAALKAFYACNTPLRNLPMLKLKATSVVGAPGVVDELIAFAADLDYSTMLNRAVGTPFYLEANADGSKLLVKENTDATWTVNDEIDKLICNVARAREWIGVHYRIDDNEGFNFCEEATYRYIKDHLTVWAQDRIIRAPKADGSPDPDGAIIDLLPPAVSLTKYNGANIIITPHK
jgi:hypothetical protein